VLGCSGSEGAGSVGRDQPLRPPSGCAVAPNSAGPSVAEPDAQPPLHALGKDDNGRAGTGWSCLTPVPPPALTPESSHQRPARIRSPGWSNCGGSQCPDKRPGRQVALIAALSHSPLPPRWRPDHPYVALAILPSTCRQAWRWAPQPVLGRHFEPAGRLPRCHCLGLHRHGLDAYPRPTTYWVAGAVLALFLVATVVAGGWLRLLGTLVC
jgi:hypothetical protein